MLLSVEESGVARGRSDVDRRRSVLWWKIPTYGLNQKSTQTIRVPASSGWR